MIRSYLRTLYFARTIILKQDKYHLFYLFSSHLIDLIMKSVSTISKIFAAMSLIAASIWVGSYFTRLFLVYQLFEGTDLILRDYINGSNMDGILFSLLPAIIVQFISFIVMIISIILFYLTSNLSLRFNGWLFIILMGVLITLPFEIYLMIIDSKIIVALMNTSFDSIQIIILLKDRIKTLSSFPVVELLTYLSFYYFIVFQPITKGVEKKV